MPQNSGKEGETREMIVWLAKLLGMSPLELEAWIWFVGLIGGGLAGFVALWVMVENSISKRRKP